MRSTGAAGSRSTLKTAIRRPSALGVLFEELDGVADGQNGFSCVIRNLATEFLLKGHDELDGVEAVGTKVVDEACRFRNLVGLNAQMLYDDLFDPLADITHRLTL